jgi:uncharacterized integral membrane protein
MLWNIRIDDIPTRGACQAGYESRHRVSIYQRARGRFGTADPTAGPTADPAEAVDHPGPPVAAATSPPGAGSAALPDAPGPDAASSAPPASGHAAPERVKVARTRIGGTWVAVVIAVLVLIFLLIFIMQNLTGVRVFFLGAGGTLPLGVAMLFAAIAGALLVALIGSARILQLRHAARRRPLARRPVGG